MKKEIFINSYVKRDGTHVREHYRTIDSDTSSFMDNSTYSGPVFSEYEGNSGKVMYMGASPVLQGGVSMDVGIPPVLSGGVSMDTLPWGKIGEVAGEVLGTVIEVGSELLPIAANIYNSININSAPQVGNIKPRFNESVKILDTKVEQMKQNIDTSVKELLKIKDQAEYKKKYKEFMKDYSVYKSTTNLANSLKINAHSGNYEKIAQDIKSYAQDLRDKGITVAKAQPVSQYEKYLNNKYKGSGNLFNNTAVVNNGASSSVPNNVQKYQEINPVGYEKIEPVGHEEIKPVKHEKIKVEGTTDKKLWILPFPEGYTMTSPYGVRIHPIKKIPKLHDGIDINTPANTPVYSIDNGVVSDACWKSGYGNYIEIKHKGEISSFYAHLNKINVKKGDRVNQRQEIGKSGNTGIGTGPHLHFGIKKNGKTVDPIKYLPKF